MHKRADPRCCVRQELTTAGRQHRRTLLSRAATCSWPRQCSTAVQDTTCADPASSAMLPHCCFPCCCPGCPCCCCCSCGALAAATAASVPDADAADGGSTASSVMSPNRATQGGLEASWYSSEPTSLRRAGSRGEQWDDWFGTTRHNTADPTASLCAPAQHLHNAACRHERQWLTWKHAPQPHPRLPFSSGGSNTNRSPVVACVGDIQSRQLLKYQAIHPQLAHICAHGSTHVDPEWRWCRRCTRGRCRCLCCRLTQASLCRRGRIACRSCSGCCSCLSCISHELQGALVGRVAADTWLQKHQSPHAEVDGCAAGASPPPQGQHMLPQSWQVALAGVPSQQLQLFVCNGPRRIKFRGYGRLAAVRHAGSRGERRRRGGCRQRLRCAYGKKWVRE